MHKLCAGLCFLLTPFRINTCKSVSKQTTLTPFRMNTYEKRGRGVPTAVQTGHIPDGLDLFSWWPARVKRERMPGAAAFALKAAGFDLSAVEATHSPLRRPGAFWCRLL